jgi:hypothetical protein
LPSNQEHLSRAKHIVMKQMYENMVDGMRKVTIFCNSKKMKTVKFRCLFSKQSREISKGQGSQSLQHVVSVGTESA